jgi:hypothetical protein
MVWAEKLIIHFKLEQAKFTLVSQVISKSNQQTLDKVI